MRSCFKTTALLLPLLLLAACFSERVESKLDPHANLTDLRTYAWLAKKPSAPQDPRFDNDVVNARVRRSGNAVLSDKGYALATDDNPDFLVAFRITTADIAGDNDIPDYFGYFPIAWGGIGFYASEVQEGTMVIDIVDARSKKMIWRGVGERQVDPDISPKRRLDRIESGVAKVMDQFPARDAK